MNVQKTILGPALPNMPWEARPKGTSDVVWRYSKNPMDLGNLAPEEFKTALAEVLASAKPTLTRDAHVVINIGDLYMDGRFYPLHAGVIEAATSAGFSLRNTIIWDRLPLLNNTGIFGYPSNFITIGTSFEYLLHFVPNQEQVDSDALTVFDELGEMGS